MVYWGMAEELLSLRSRQNPSNANFMEQIVWVNGKVIEVTSTLRGEDETPFDLPFVP